MLMPPRLRKLGLLAHIVASVGWLGAVLVSLVLAIVGLTAADEQLAAASYLAFGRRAESKAACPAAEATR